MSYDSLDRLTGIEKGDIRVKLAYDPFDRCLSREVWRGEKKVEEVLYMWDGDNEIGCYENGAMCELRVLGEGLGDSETGGAVFVEIEGKSYVPIHDHRGCVVVLVEAETKQPVETNRYTAFGEELEGEGFCPWRFASKRVEPETGLVYFGRRYYSPVMGRWITPDPQGFDDGPNLYAYLHNCPLNDFDPYGLFSWMNMWEGASRFGWGASRYAYDIGMGMGYGLGKMGEWMYADFQYEYLNDPSFFHAKSQSATEGWKHLGRTAYHDPLGTLAPGLMEAWRMPPTASFGDKAEAWGKAAVDVGLAASFLWKGAQAASSFRVAGQGGRLGEAGALLGAFERETGILATPKVENLKLQNIISDLYKGTTNPNRIATGTTADAVRQELITGKPTFGRFHIQKAQDYSRALENWLIKNPNSAYKDRLVAQSVLNDLKNALGVKQ